MVCAFYHCPHFPEYFRGPGIAPRPHNYEIWSSDSSRVKLTPECRCLVFMLRGRRCYNCIAFLCKGWSDYFSWALECLCFQHSTKEGGLVELHRSLQCSGVCHVCPTQWYEIGKTTWQKLWHHVCVRAGIWPTVEELRDSAELQRWTCSHVPPKGICWPWDT